MQIAEHTYFNIEIDGYNKKDFIRPEDVLDVEIVETAGASLPFIFVSLMSGDEEMLQHLMQKNTFTIYFGESKKSADSFRVQIFSNIPPNTNGTGERFLVEFGGYILNNQYMINRENRAYFGNSLLVAKKVIKDNFKMKPKGGFSTGITKVNENQVIWRQEECDTTPLFLADTLVHMDIRPSFPLFTFDKYGTFYLRSFDEVAKAGAVVTFTARTPEKFDEIQYVNSFSVNDFRETYHLYSGYNKVTKIYNLNKGMEEYVKSYDEPILASTKEAESLDGTMTAALNKYQGANVHNTYVESFVYNTNKLVALSAMEGCLELVGRYYKHLKPTDIVQVTTSGENKQLEGLYVIDSIRTQIDMERGGIIHTYVYVTRDNKNNIENYIANPKKGVNVTKKFFASTMNSIGQLRVAYAMAQNVMDGRYLREILSFAIETKRNLLRSFVVAGVGIDFNSSALLIQSLVNVGNSLMNTLVDMIFPESIAYVFHDFILRKPSLLSLLSKYIAEYVPAELQALISMFSNSLFGTTSSLNSIARANGIKVTASSTVGKETTVGGEDTVIDTTNTSEIDYRENNQSRIEDIVTQLENNSSWLGLDIPFPILDLTESQSLLSDPDLKKYVVTQTIANLTNLGYLDNLTSDQKDLFEDILMGDQPVDDLAEVNELARQINTNAGSTLYYRYWGTFNNLLDLTDFYIKKCYKDRYKTLPCTKLINATQNSKIFFACPEGEEDVRFYINSKRVDVVEDLDTLIQDPETAEEYKYKQVIGYFAVDLGFYRADGTPVPYRVYYTNLGYNSNSVLFEVKQGGMV